MAHGPSVQLDWELNPLPATQDHICPIHRIKESCQRIKSRGIKRATDRCGRIPQNWLPKNAGTDGCTNQGRVRPQQNDFTLKPEHLVQQPIPLNTPGLYRIRPNTPWYDDKNRLRAHGYTHIPTIRRIQGYSGPWGSEDKHPKGTGGLSVSWSGLPPKWQNTQIPALCLPRWASVSQRRRQDKWQSVSCARCQCGEFWTRTQVTAQSLMFFITNIVDSLDLMEWREKSTCKQLSFCYF